MKKIFMLVLASLMMLVLGGCSSDSAAATTSSKASTATSAKAATTSSSSGTGTNAKALVVYFSATGNTKALAQTAAEALGADTFEIVPEKVYTKEDLNYNDETTRATVEMKDESARPAIKNKLEGLEKYETIVIAYPIWWGAGTAHHRHVHGKLRFEWQDDRANLHVLVERYRLVGRLPASVRAERDVERWQAV